MANSSQLYVIKYYPEMNIDEVVEEVNARFAPLTVLLETSIRYYEGNFQFFSQRTFPNGLNKRTTYRFGEGKRAGKILLPFSHLMLVHEKREYDEAMRVGRAPRVAGLHHIEECVVCPLKMSREEDCLYDGSNSLFGLIYEATRSRDRIYQTLKPQSIVSWAQFTHDEYPEAREIEEARRLVREFEERHKAA